MTEGASEAPPALLTGLRALRAHPQCSIIGDVELHEPSGRWVVHVALEIDTASEYVEKRTSWSVLVDAVYPFGKVDYYPEEKNGLTATFPHQSRNTPPTEKRPWRGGKLCLDTPFRGERRNTSIKDPIGDADTRLRWHAQRALAWLDAAACDRLLAPGDPFELPERPNDLKAGSLVHDESSKSLEVWSKHIGTWGTANLGILPEFSDVLVLASFATRNGEVIREWDGREPDTTSKELPHVYWWLWPKPIVVPPWHSPGTWGELRCAGKHQNVNVDRTLEELARRLRGAKRPVILLIGYPVPKYLGEKPFEIHWDAIRMPKLPPTKGKLAPGFRNNDLGWWHRDRQGELRNQAPVQAHYIENWHSDRIQARGRLPNEMRFARIGIIGIGALGSAIAELLVRTGCTRITLFDPERLAAGNICRHQATLKDLGQKKARVMSRRLRQISPHVDIIEFSDGLPLDASSLTETVANIDILIECTASDEVTQVISKGWWSLPKLFTSFSLGHSARRLFSFGVFSHAFPVEDFDNRMSPWLADESWQWAEGGELLEGAGCWSPLFPARHDDVLLAAAVCVKELEAMIANRPLSPELRVFQQTQGQRGFSGFQVIGQPDNGDEAK